MRPKYLFPGLIVLILALLPFLSARVSGQTGSVPSRISAAVDNTKLMVLRGNTHPMARAEFDRGAAPASLPMEHMLLVLTRSPAQQATLETLLAQQQDSASPNYHKWLTPEQFGQQFGPSDQDIQTITSWLQSNGFQINNVATGRTTIDFSGTAGAVQQAFHTAIHSYILANGEQHWANSSDPQIPVALAPVVAGVNSMNNFRRRPMSHSVGVFRRTEADGKVTRISPQFTYAGGCNGSGTNCYALGPADFAAIYNSQALLNAGINGTGQTIAIISDSDINMADVTSFRSLFGLPTINFQQIQTAPTSDPGVQAAGDEIEAILDVEWSGAVAPGAKIDLVVSPTTRTTFGGDTSAQYIISNNLASVLAYSYGACELDLGTGGNAFYSGLWQQAQAQGITVVVSTGDNGSSGCDPLNTSQTVDNPAQYGLAVNGVGSTPSNIAVGGTDFNDLTASQASSYWTSSNSALQASAKGYIPETAYNDSCTNALIYASNGLFGFSNFSSAEAACNSATLSNDGFIYPAGGSGGVSNCTTNSTSNTIGPVSSCSGGYPKPSWQTGPGVPADGKRDLPDVSLFSGDGTIQNFYIICQADQDPGNAACSLTYPAGFTNGQPYSDFEGVGGTSVAAQAFAGIVALIDQKTGSRQGNLNPTLYALAAEQTSSNCNASGTPASNCVFNDVTSGTIAMPCLKNSPNCTVTNSSDSNGVLSGYNAAVGYDLATGLGSINVGNLVNSFGPNFYLSSSNPIVTVASPGASGTMSVTAYGATTNQSTNPYLGTITLACSGLPSGATCSFAGGSGFTAPNSVTFTAALTSVPVTVTVNTTTASGIAPSSRPQGMMRWTTGVWILIELIIFLAILFASGSRMQLGWSMTSFLLALCLVTAIAACGGGSSTTIPSSNSTSGPTGNTSAILTGTATSGSPVSSMNFTVTIQ